MILTNLEKKELKFIFEQHNKAYKALNTIYKSITIYDPLDSEIGIYKEMVEEIDKFIGNEFGIKDNFHKLNAPRQNQLSDELWEILTNVLYFNSDEYFNKLIEFIESWGSRKE